MDNLRPSLRRHEYMYPDQVEAQLRDVRGWDRTLNFNFRVNPSKQETLLLVKGEIRCHNGAPIAFSTWLDKSFPRVPPLISVDVKQELKVKGCPHIDEENSVRHDYLNSWDSKTSSLVDCLQLMTMEFSDSFPTVQLDGFPSPNVVERNIIELREKHPRFTLEPFATPEHPEALILVGNVKIKYKASMVKAACNILLHRPFPNGPPNVYLRDNDYKEIRIPYLDTWNKHSTLCKLVDEVMKEEERRLSMPLPPLPVLEEPKPTEQPRHRDRPPPEPSPAPVAHRPPWMAQKDDCDTGSGEETERPDKPGKQRDRRQPKPSRPIPAEPKDSSSLPSNVQPPRHQSPARRTQSDAVARVSGVHDPLEQADDELVEFVIKGGLTEATLHCLVRHGFTSLRPVLAMNESDIQRLELPEHAQAVLLRDAIRRHKEDHATKDSGKSDQRENSKRRRTPYENDAVVLAGALQGLIKEMSLNSDDIDKDDLIGNGQFGTVFKGKYRNRHLGKTELVAIKTVTLESQPDGVQFIKEIFNMKMLKHPNVLELKGVTLSENRASIITPFMVKGDLRGYISDKKKTFEVIDLLRLGLDVGKGMRYLSEHGIVHGDLAARNCLIDENETVKVCDFGLSAHLFNSNYFRFDPSTTARPLRWMAPECITQYTYSLKSDVWSYGVLLWELLTRGLTPYKQLSDQEVVSRVTTGYRLPRPAHVTEETYSVVEQCWQGESGQRPTFRVLVLMLEMLLQKSESQGRVSGYDQQQQHTDSDNDDRDDDDGGPPPPPVPPRMTQAPAQGPGGSPIHDRGYLLPLSQRTGPQTQQQETIISQSGPPVSRKHKPNMPSSGAVCGAHAVVGPPPNRVPSPPPQYR